ncbi:MAG: hypothetical protein JNG89_21770 [Planctomycetaceae bacterium]|nr:hypothetical protein [Planctomycetaceae bacterium]
MAQVNDGDADALRRLSARWSVQPHICWLRAAETCLASDIDSLVTADYSDEFVLNEFPRNSSFFRIVMA